MSASTAKSTTPVDAYIGARIRMRRTIAGMSQTELGEKIGVTFQQVQKYEKGTNRVSAARLEQVAAALGVPSSVFTEGAHAAGAAPGGPTDLAGELMVQLLGTSDGIALAQAFTQIPSAEHRGAVVRVARAIADAVIAGEAAAEEGRPFGKVFGVALVTGRMPEASA